MAQPNRVNKDWSSDPNRLFHSQVATDTNNLTYAKIPFENKDVGAVILRRSTCPSAEEWQLFNKQLGCGSYGCVFTHSQAPHTLNRLRQTYGTNDALVLKLMLSTDLPGTDELRELKYAYEASLQGVAPRIYGIKQTTTFTTCPITMFLDRKTPQRPLIPLYFQNSPRNPTVSAYVMQMIDGLSVADWLLQGSNVARELSKKDFCDKMLPQLMSQLRTIHQKMGIVHGDVRWHLNNIMMDRKWTRTYLIDWGFARNKVENQQQFKKNAGNSSTANNLFFGRQWSYVRDLIIQLLLSSSNTTANIVIDYLATLDHVKETSPVVLFESIAAEQYFEVLQLLALLLNDNAITKECALQGWNLYLHGEVPPPTTTTTTTTTPTPAPSPSPTYHAIRPTLTPTPAPSPTYHAIWPTPPPTPTYHAVTSIAQVVLPKAAAVVVDLVTPPIEPPTKPTVPPVIDLTLDSDTPPPPPPPTTTTKKRKRANQ